MHINKHNCDAMIVAQPALASPALNLEIEGNCRPEGLLSSNPCNDKAATGLIPVETYVQHTRSKSISWSKPNTSGPTNS